MERYVLWILTLVPIFCGVLMVLVLWIRFKVFRDNKQVDERIILLSEIENTRRLYDGLDSTKNSPKRAICSKKENYAEKSNYLPQITIGRYEICDLVNNLESFYEWINQYYRLILKFSKEDSKWSIEIAKLSFLVPNYLEIDPTNKYFVTMVVVGHEFEKIQKIKTEIKKYQQEIVFGSKIFVLNSIEDVVVELQLFSIDRYARQRVRSEIVVHTDRIANIHPSLELGNLVIDVGNIEKEADVMNKNEDISKNLLLSFTSIYSYKTGLLSIFFDQVNPNMMSITRRYSEVELFIILHIDKIILDCQKARCVELGSPNSFTNEDATVFTLNTDDVLGTAQISFQILIRTSLTTYKKLISIFLFSQHDDSRSIFNYDVADLYFQNQILYARNVVSSQLEEEKDVTNKDAEDQ